MRAPNHSRWCRIQCKGAGRALAPISRVSVAKGSASGASGPHYLEDCSIGDGVGHRVKVTRLPRTRYRGNLQLSSALDLAERPQSKRQWIVHRRDAKVLTCIQRNPKSRSRSGSNKASDCSKCRRALMKSPSNQQLRPCMRCRHGGLASVGRVALPQVQAPPPARPPCIVVVSAAAHKASGEDSIVD